MKLSEAQRLVLKTAHNGDGSFHTSVEDLEVSVCQPLEKAGHLSNRLVYEDRFGQWIWSYLITPAGIKALEDSNETE